VRALGPTLKAMKYANNIFTKVTTLAFFVCVLFVSPSKALAETFDIGFALQPVSIGGVVSGGRYIVQQLYDGSDFCNIGNWALVDGDDVDVGSFSSGTFDGNFMTTVAITTSSNLDNGSSGTQPSWADIYTTYGEGTYMLVGNNAVCTDFPSIDYPTENSVFIDEIGVYFDARNWENLSMDFRMWLTMGGKRGVTIYGTCQDFSQIDKSFRLLTTRLYHVRKLFGSSRPSRGRPPTKHVWGLCMIRELDPTSYDDKEFKPIGIFPGFFRIKRRHTEMFDTKQIIQRSAPPLLKREVRVWLDENGKVGYQRVRYF